VNRSKWNAEAVGTIVFVLRKKSQKGRILTENERKINEMRSHFRRDMNDYFQMIEDEADGRKKRMKPLR
jgi:hypothetical protein